MCSYGWIARVTMQMHKIPNVNSVMNYKKAHTKSGKTKKNKAQVKLKTVYSSQNGALESQANHLRVSAFILYERYARARAT